MQFEVWAKGLATLSVDCIVLGVFEEGELTEEAQSIDAASSGYLKKLLARGDFSGRAGETLLLTELPGVEASRVLLTGLGARKSFGRKSWRRSLGAAITAISKTRIVSIALGVERPPVKELDDYYFGRAVAEIVGSTLYRVNDLKTTKKSKATALQKVLAGPVRKAGVEAVERGLEHGQAVTSAVSLHRDLANLPANVCTPTYLADQARALGKQHTSLRVQVLDAAAIKKEKMGCLLAVSQGSHEPPRFIVLEHRAGHRGDKTDSPPVVLVGKGVTFDTGGISLKDPPGMDEMKFDMSGAAAVMAAMSLVARLRLPMRVIGLIGAVENMPGSRAVKPGDIATSASGLTVEILNTDAEGRLVLCDALHYARRFNPTAVVDIATLTGACVIALGHHHSGAMGNDEDLVHELVEAGVRADDRAWHMPLTDEYGDQLKSNFADFANVGGREGGAITAAAFLSKFTKGLKWAHLDVAGTAYQGGAQKGSTGRPTPLLADFLIRRAGL
jgi:leucyl aminopeptidase